MAEEGLRKTDNKLIHIGNPIPFEQGQLLIELQALMDTAYANKVDIREQLIATVPTFHPTGTAQPIPAEQKKVG